MKKDFIEVVRNTALVMVPSALGFMTENVILSFVGMGIGLYLLVKFGKGGSDGDFMANDF